MFELHDATEALMRGKNLDFFFAAEFRSDRTKAIDLQEESRHPKCQNPKTPVSDRNKRAEEAYRRAELVPLASPGWFNMVLELALFRPTYASEAPA